MCRVWLVAMAGFLVAFLVVAAVVGPAPAAVLSGEGWIEVFSPAGVSTFERELRALW